MHDVEQHAADVVALGRSREHTPAAPRGRPSGAGGPACTPPRRGRRSRARRRRRRGRRCRRSGPAPARGRDRLVGQRAAGVQAEQPAAVAARVDAAPRAPACRARSRRPRRTRRRRASGGPRTAPRRPPSRRTRRPPACRRRRPSPSRCDGLARRRLGHQQQRLGRRRRPASSRIASRNMIPPTVGGEVAPADADDVRHAGARPRRAGIAASWAPVPAAATMPTRARSGPRWRSPSPTWPSIAVPQPGPITSRPSSAPRRLSATSSAAETWSEKRNTCMPGGQRAVGLEHGVLARHRDQRDVGARQARTRRQRARRAGRAPRRGRRAPPPARRARARPRRARPPGPRRRSRCRVGPASQRTPSAASASRFAGVPIATSARRTPSWARRSLRDLHQPHAVDVAVADDAHGPAHACHRGLRRPPPARTHVPSVAVDRRDEPLGGW